MATNVSIDSMTALLDEDQAAALMGFSVRALQAWRINGKGPPFLKISSRAVRYRIGDLEKWLSQKIRYSTSEITANSDTSRDLK